MNKAKRLVEILANVKTGSYPILGGMRDSYYEYFDSLDLNEMRNIADSFVQIFEKLDALGELIKAGQLSKVDVLFMTLDILEKGNEYDVMLANDLVKLYEQFHRSKKAKETILELKEFDFTIDDTKKRFLALMEDIGKIEDENSSLVYHMRMGDIKMIESSLDYIAIERELLELERKYHKADVQREKYLMYKDIYLSGDDFYNKKYKFYLKKCMKLRKQIYELEVKLYGRE